MVKAQEGVNEEFWKLVNLSKSELSRWLETKESKSVGFGEDGEESVGHQSGRRIVEILGKGPDGVDEEDEAHMRKVVAYCKRHLKQRPSKDVATSKWCYSLKNWGHDPTKEADE